jgi:ech hydrogenase subunit A
MDVVLTLVFLPTLAALLLLLSRSIAMQYLIVSVTLLLLSGISGYLFLMPAIPLALTFSPGLETLLVAADVALLLYFVQQGFRHRSNEVMGLAVLQLLFYGLLEMSLGHESGAALIVDKLSLMMFLIVNVVGGTIVFYALRYMADETMSPFKKRLFIAYLLIFLSIMNTIVIANSLLLFFFLFEKTTLASYLLIGYRKDALSQKNALRALWMNQVGGVAILLGTMVAVTQFETIYFDTLISSSGHYLLFAMALLAVAALVKGAALPFDSWLLGAMVAPTPVSAILHSATMVKIAPYLILKLAPAIAATLLGSILSITGALVFVAASYLALSRSLFKEILGYSTIALLGLMISLAAIGTEESMTLAMVLIVFHALSKALLFLSAGVLEKSFHLKNIEEMKGLAAVAPQSVRYIMFGFISLTLPPFGLFMGKLFAIESVAALLGEEPWLIIVLLAIILGSVLLVLLYFKVASALLSRPSDIFTGEAEKMPLGFRAPLILLTLLSLGAAAAFLFQQNDTRLIIFLLPLLLLALLPWIVRKMEGFDRVNTYHCGEKESFDAALFYFEPSHRTAQFIYWGFGALFAAILLAGAFS